MRWLDTVTGGEAPPPGVAELLRAAQPPSPPPAPVRARLGSELARLAGMPQPWGPWRQFGAGAAVAAVAAGAWLGISRLQSAGEVPPSVVAAAHDAARRPPPVSPVPRLELPAPAAPAGGVAGPAAAELDRPEAPAAPVQAPAPPPARAAASRRSVARSAAAPAARSSSSRAAAPAAAAAPAPVDSLVREAALVEEARREVRVHPAAALAALDRHRREFPAGQLTAEREFLTIHALVQLGRGAEAEARGRRLVQQYPGSAYAQQVPALLARARR